MGIEIFLKEKVVVVTGGDKGIGRAVVEGAAKCGAHVIFTYNRNEEGANKLKEDIASLYKVEVNCFSLDLTAQNIEEKVSKELKKIGRVDVLVNNGGFVRDGLFLMSDYVKWREVIECIFFGSVRVTREVLPYMVSQRKGSIINVISVGGVIGIPGQTNYTAAKGGLVSFTKSLAKELAKLNIRVNGVAPGYVDTEMVRAYSEEKRKEFLRNVPMQRFAKPEEIANVILFLASDLSSYMTGEVVVVDGGMIA